MIKLSNQPNKKNKTQTIKYDYVWGPQVIFYLMRESGEPVIGESEDCDAKSQREA